MKISHKWLQTYFKKPLPSSEEIANLLTFHIFEVEGIEKKTNDDVLDVKVLPDRASYCLSYYGIAKELAALLPQNEFKERDIENIVDAGDLTAPSISIEAGDVCDVYSALQIINITKTKSPDWLVDALHSMGQKSINVFADISNYVMFDMGQPMHVFDAGKIKDEIVVRYAREGEKIITLDNKEISLDKDIVVIADKESPCALAGIKGGKNAETTYNTHHIIVESAHFDATYVRKTSTRLNIKTDSSKRFENKISAQITERALGLFVCILKQTDPDIIVSPITKAGTYKKTEHRIEVTESFVQERIGTALSLDEMVLLLNRASVSARREGNVLALYPDPSRQDLKIKEDVVDEVGRLMGYDNVLGVLPKIKGLQKYDHKIALRTKVRNFFIQEGFSEIMTYAFAAQGEREVLKPLSQEQRYLRTNLSDAMEEKINNALYYADLIGMNKVCLYEFGNVWKDGREFLSLCVGIGYKKTPKGIRVNDEIKEIRDKVFELLGVKVEILCTIDDTGGIISKNGQSIGLTNHKEGIFEVDFDHLVDTLSSQKTSLDILPIDTKYKTPSIFPFVVRDFAVFTPKGTEARLVWDTVLPVVKDLLYRYELFDSFEKKNKDTGEVEKVSYAYRMVFQSYEKTLTDEEVNTMMQKVYDMLQSKGWEIR